MCCILWFNWRSKWATTRLANSAFSRTENGRSNIHEHSARAGPKWLSNQSALHKASFPWPLGSTDIGGWRAAALSVIYIARQRQITIARRPTDRPTGGGPARTKDLQLSAMRPMHTSRIHSSQSCGTHRGQHHTTPTTPKTKKILRKF